MKYQLSFCEIEQLSENIFEVVVKEGTMLDKKCADEVWTFWNDLRDESFGLLVNCKNKYTRSFEGSLEVGKHPLQQKTAYFCNADDHYSKEQLEITLQIIEMTDHSGNHKVFTDRAEAIIWLADI